MQLQARLLTHLCQQRNQIQSLVWRRYLSTSNLKEIYEIPKVASWSLKELHQEKHHTQDEHHVLSERKLLELAELCHLELNAAEIPSLLKDVESIIQCTKTIQAVTLEENVDDFYAQGKCEGNITHAPLREDVVVEGNCPDEVLANAAEKSGYYFKVPKVLQD